MRMRFEAGAEEEFEAGCGLLVDRLVRWAGERGLPVDGFLVETMLEYRHRVTVDGRLGLWEPRHVKELLLVWLPEPVTELPGEERGDAPGTLRALLRFLHAAQLADPRGPVLEDSLAAVDAVAEEYPAAMADRTRWGLAKFWAMTAGFDDGADLQHRMWFEHADRDLRVVLDALVDLGAIEHDRGMADPVFLDVDLFGAGDELPTDMPPELAELLGNVGAPKDAAAQERARARREELAAGPVELLRLTELGTRAVRQRLLAVGRDAPLRRARRPARYTGLRQPGAAIRGDVLRRLSGGGHPGRVWVMRHSRRGRSPSSNAWISSRLQPSARASTRSRGKK